MVFIKGQSGNPNYQKKEDDKVTSDAIDAQIEDLKKQKEIIENPELAKIDEFNAVFSYFDNNMKMIHDRIMRLELSIAEIIEFINTPKQAPISDIPPVLPPIEDLSKNFVKSEKMIKKGLFK